MADRTEIDLSREDVVDDHPIGIISALPEEEEAFSSCFVEIETGERLGFHVRHGTIDNKPVVLMQSGVGKVNAAMASMMLINEFLCGSVIMAGVAGSLTPAVSIGDVVVASRVVQYDYGAVIDDRVKVYQPGTMPLPGNEGPIGYAPKQELLEKLKRGMRGIDLPPLSRALTNGELRIPKLHIGTLASGDAFINCVRTRDRLAYEFGALAVEMEGGAVAQVADHFGLPWLIVRGASDLVGNASHVDFPAFMREVSNSVAAIVRRMVGIM